MKSLSCALLALFACSSSSATPAPSIYGNWNYVGTDGTSRRGLSLKSDGTYVVSWLTLTSPAAAEAELETGTIAVTDSTIRFTPQMWSCNVPGAPPYVATYQFNDGNLQLTPPRVPTAFQSQASPVESEFALTTGCFLQTATFLAGPLSSVGSCSAGGTACEVSTPCCLGLSCLPGGAVTSCVQSPECSSGCCLPLSYAGQSSCPDAGH